MDGGSEEASGGGIERGREGATWEQGRETSREVSRGGHWPVYSIHKPPHNVAVAIGTLLLQMKNSEQV